MREAVDGLPLTRRPSMPKTATIQPSVSPALLTKVTRLFNGSVRDGLSEMFQNARRAGATEVHVRRRHLNDQPTLIVRDDGAGIADPATLLALGASGWDDEIAHREDPAGMGVFSLAGKHVVVRSRTPGSLMGWRVTITPEAWSGQIPLLIEDDDIPVGTEFQVALSDAWRDGLDRAVAAAARHFPLPVYFQGQPVERSDFLDGAVKVIGWNGCLIGIFQEGERDATSPTINFHGVTVPCTLPVIEEVGETARWQVKIDIVNAPDLQLVLPARKEMVECPALDDLRTAAEWAIFQTISTRDEHRLSFETWQRARLFGITLPEAAPRLWEWNARQADSEAVSFSDLIMDQPMFLVPPQSVDMEQALDHILTDDNPFGGTPVDAQPKFEGYDWYDRLPRLADIEAIIDIDGTRHRYGNTGKIPKSVESGRVEDIKLRLMVAVSGKPGASLDTYSFPLDLLICCDDYGGLDEAVVLLRKDVEVEPARLADALEACCFSFVDDNDCDSWYTQHHDFQQQARALALTLLLDEEQALIQQLKDIVDEHLLWLIPEGRSIEITATRGNLSLSLA
ncbi:ATP-binding protein [Sandaracinobacter sp. RS1-74]|uniref:ATP-binding protein n=1 Tax=Sandaracinobacteroides sayramensis TaxID=2913411 RepID=UPI001EDC7E32|nr:ATP-binding protein [Sandaracinobacteroides sayramensis]MCG2841259.1 ATP-binding protein [Sandaracinobacteroides sayramensis]